MKKILIATNNKGKIKEIKEILKEYELVSLEEIGCKIDVVEDKESFEGNAVKKAKEISEATNMPCIADDSGLCIDEFNGWPGVYTARFLGEDSTPRQRNEYILNKMKKLKDEKRKARVKCVVVYCENGKETIAIGEIEGKIAYNYRGKNGFGFDEIFELENGKTYAELTQKEKNKISHRKIALENLKILMENK